jgi:DNA-directed RNA polymerase specialized sigma24 family protein
MTSGALPAVHISPKKSKVVPGPGWETWVDLLRRYSNRSDLQQRLAEALAEVRRHGGQEHESSAAGWGRVSGQYRRLTVDSELALAAEFLSGTSKRALAERYAVSLSTVKNILRRHGVRRPNPG